MNEAHTLMIGLLRKRHTSGRELWCGEGFGQIKRTEVKRPELKYHTLSTEGAIAQNPPRTIAQEETLGGRAISALENEISKVLVFFMGEEHGA